MPAYSKPVVSNYYLPSVTNASYWACTGCLQAWEAGESDVLGQCGCVFPVIDAANAAAFSGRVRNVTGGASVVQTVECARCMLMNRQCLAPPNCEFVNLDRVWKIILVLRSGLCPDNTAVLDVDDDMDPLSGPTHTMTTVERDAFKWRLGQQAKGAKRALESDYSPCWDKLEFHNGKLAKTDCPLSGCRPPNASRSKGATEIKKKAKVEIENKRVREEVEEAEKGNGTPKKARASKRPTAAAIEGDVAVLNAEISALETRYASCKGKKAAQDRSKITKEIKAKQAEIHVLQQTLV